jgi:hypothetical protein
MRLSDAGLRRRERKPLYPDHRLPPWLNEDATRDRLSRLLGIVRITATREFISWLSPKLRGVIAVQVGASWTVPYVQYAISSDSVYT